MARRSQKVTQQQNTEQRDGHIHRLPEQSGARNPQADVSALQDAVGNHAVDQWMQFQASKDASSADTNDAKTQGQPLSSADQTFFEAHLGQDLSEVRIHTNQQAAEQADRLNAEAFTAGQDIVLGSEAPDLQSPAGKALLAHELAHTVQQQQAQVEENQISQKADAAEKQADQTAEKIMQGQQGHIQSSGTVPGIQRKPKNRELVGPIEVEAALQKFFRRSQQAQGEEDFRITAQVKQGIQLIFSEDPLGWLNIQSLLNRLDYPGDSADFSRQIAAGLSGPINPDLLKQLEKMSVRDKSPGRLGRLKNLVKRTKPGKSPKINVPDPLSSEKHFKQGVSDLEKQSKQAQPDQAAGPKPSTGQKAKALLLKPRSVDVLRLGRIAAGLPEAIRGPKPPPAAVRELPPEVEQAIQTQIKPEDLPNVGEEDIDARLVAQTLARLLDQAHHSGESEIQLDLKNHYQNVKTILPVLQGLKRIAQVVKAALPHQAPSVTRLEIIYGGDKRAKLTIGKSSK